jgi:hypothetical protein
MLCCASLPERTNEQCCIGSTAFDCAAVAVRSKQCLSCLKICRLKPGTWRDHAALKVGSRAKGAAMTKLPPVPKEDRSQKGPGENPQIERDSSDYKPPRENLKEQGRQGNIAQNTTNQGYQQDR